MDGMLHLLICIMVLAGCATALRITYNTALWRRRRSLIMCHAAAAAAADHGNGNVAVAAADGSGNVADEVVGAAAAGYGNVATATAASGYEAAAESCSSKHQQLAMAIILVLPFQLLTAFAPSTTLRVILCFTYCWVVPCKLLLLFYANFFLDSPSAWTLSGFNHFLLAFLPPIRLKGRLSKPAIASFSVAVFLQHHLPPLLFEFSLLFLHFFLYHILPPALAHVSHCIALYLVLDLPHRIASMIFLHQFRIQLHPIFVRPWLSSSLTDFWGQRWDLTANALLRHTVYNPVINLLTLSPSLSTDITAVAHSASTLTQMDMIKLLLQLPLAAISAFERACAAAASCVGTECISKENPIMASGKGSLQEKMDLVHAEKLRPSPYSIKQLMEASTKPPSLAVRLTAVNATFLVSGLIHELLYFCLTQGEAPTWEVTAFFMVQGVATSMEIVMRRSSVIASWSCTGARAAGGGNGDAGISVCRRIIRDYMKRAGKVGMTMGFMYATATWLFFPQLVRAGVFTECAQEHQAVKQGILKMLL